MWIFWLIDGVFVWFFFLQILQRKKSTDDELCGIEIYCTFLSIAKKKLFDLGAWSLQMISFVLWEFLPIQVSNSRSINDYRCKSSRFKANTAIIMPIQIVCLIWIHTYINDSIAIDTSQQWIYGVVKKKHWTQKKNQHTKQTKAKNKNKAQQQREKKLIDFSAWIKTKLSTQCIKWIKNLFCSDKR